MGEFSPWHLLIVALVFVVLFGSKRLPDAARSLGRSMRILKAETAGLRNDQDPTSDVHKQAPLPTPQPAIGAPSNAGRTMNEQPGDAPRSDTTPELIVTQPV